MVASADKKINFDLLLISAGVILFSVWFLYSTVNWFAGLHGNDGKPSANDVAARMQALNSLQKTIDDPVQNAEEMKVRQKALQDLEKKLGPGDVNNSFNIKVDLENLNKAL